MQAETALRGFMQTLAKTFAHLPTGLAIFDQHRQLALFNPALAPLGKWTARIEAAPVRFVSLALDGSLLKIDFPNVPTIERKSIEIGVHVWPGGGGLRGFYVGPRHLHGNGDSNEATGKLTG